MEKLEYPQSETMLCCGLRILLLLLLLLLVIVVVVVVVVVVVIRQMLEKKWDYNEEVHQLFIDFKKAYDSVTREVLYKILIEFGIPKKLVRLI